MRKLMDYNERLYNSIYSKISDLLLTAKKTSYYNETISYSEKEIREGLSYEQFSKIPYLTKDIYRKNIFRMIDSKFLVNQDNYEKYGMDFNAKKKYLLDRGFYVKVTSGSTGVPMEVIKSMNDIKRDYFSINLFRRKILGKELSGAFLWIWPTNKYTRKYFYDDKKNYYKVNQYGYQYMLAEYSEKSFKELYNFIIDNDIKWVTSSPSALVYLAEYMKKAALRKLNFNYIECHSEVLLPWQKEIIYECFGSRPISVYSSNEVQFIGMSCSNDHMHLITRNAFLEFVPNQNGRKEVVVTALNNLDVPLVRYCLGDCGDWIDDRDCELKKYPAFKLENYRKNDYLVTPSRIKFEPFVIYDSITFVVSKYNISIQKYVVIQKDYTMLAYYFDNSLDQIQMEKICSFLSDYFHEITGFKFDVEIFQFKCVLDVVGTRKFSYFMSEVK